MTITQFEIARLVRREKAWAVESLSYCLIAAISLPVPGCVQVSSKQPSADHGGWQAIGEPILPPPSCSQVARVRERRARISGVSWAGLVEDQHQFYGSERLKLLGSATAVAGLLANTDGDRIVGDFYQTSLRNAFTDDVFDTLHEAKVMGEGRVLIPLYAVACGADLLAPESELARGTAHWGQHALRATLVGAPPLLALQALTGGSRPGETSYGSAWRPTSDVNGASGHTFMGAVPFLTAAQTVDSRHAKRLLQLGSMIAGASRVNDDAHYLSQVFLGWWLAKLSVDSVGVSNNGIEATRTWGPILMSDGSMGVGVERRW